MLDEVHTIDGLHGRGRFCFSRGRACTTLVCLSTDGWISDTLTLSGVDLHPRDLPPPHGTHRHTSGHHPSALIHLVPPGGFASYSRPAFGFFVRVLLPCVGSWRSQKRWRSSSRPTSSGEKTTLTTSVCAVRPGGEAQSHESQCGCTM